MGLIFASKCTVWVHFGIANQQSKITGFAKKFKEEYSYKVFSIMICGNQSMNVQNRPPEDVLKKRCNFGQKI